MGLMSCAMGWNGLGWDGSEWIREHPECGYTLANSPHLKVLKEIDFLPWLYHLLLTLY